MRHLKFLSIQALLFVLLSAGASALDVVLIPIESPDAPAQILFYEARYYEGRYYRMSRYYYSGRGIYHTVKLKNTADEKIVTLQVGLVSFNVWDKLIDVTYGMRVVDVKPGGKSKSTWRVWASSDFSFHTGFAFLDKVRFEDGTIWECDRKFIATEIGKVFEDFDKESLMDGEEENSDDGAGEDVTPERDSD